MNFNQFFLATMGFVISHQAIAQATPVQESQVESTSTHVAVAPKGVEKSDPHSTLVGGQIRVLNSVFDHADRSKHSNYPFSIDRARLWAKRAIGSAEAYLQLRFESNQNGADNEGSPASTSSFVDVNRAYIDFKSVLNGLDIQLGKQVYKFADDSDYGLTKTDAYTFFAQPNTDYGVGGFSDYKIPSSLGHLHMAVTNGNGKSNAENNSQKAFVSYLRLRPLGLFFDGGKGLSTNLGYAINVLKKDGGENVRDSVLTLGAGTESSLSILDFGVEYNLRRTTKDGKLFGSTSGSGIAVRTGYEYEKLKLHVIYSGLERTYDARQNKGFFGGELESESKTASGSSVLLVSEYKTDPASLGVQYKHYSNDAKYFKDKAGKPDEKNADEMKFYAVMSF